MPLRFAHDTVILDASCIISLYASGVMEEILQAISKQVAVAAYVEREEALWVYTGEGEQREAIVLQSFVEAGLLTIVEIESEEESETVATLAAQRLDQGEAITGAIAIHREWTLVTDDRRARTVVGGVARRLQLLTTLELVKHWTEIDSVSPDVIAAVLHDIRRLAAYIPHRQHSHYEWWYKHHGGSAN